MAQRTLRLDPRACAPSVILAVVAAHVGLKLLFFSGAFLNGIALPIENGTDGLVTIVTLCGVIEWVLLVGLLMVGVGGLRLRDVGLTLHALAKAVPILVALWVVSQFAYVAVGSTLGEVALVGKGLSLWWWVGQRLQAVVGSGLIEEVLYRGFLLAQGFAWLRQRLDWDRALVWAVVASSAYFGLSHVPAGMQSGMELVPALGFAVQVALGGVLFAALYLRTGNLFIAAGAHALVNDPIPLTVTPLDDSLIVLIAVSALMLAWPALASRNSRVFTVGMLEGRPVME